MSLSEETLTLDGEEFGCETPNALFERLLRKISKYGDELIADLDDHPTETLAEIIKIITSAEKKEELFDIIGKIFTTVDPKPGSINAYFNKCSEENIYEGLACNPSCIMSIHNSTCKDTVLIYRDGVFTPLYINKERKEAYIYIAQGESDEIRESGIDFLINHGIESIIFVYGSEKNVDIAGSSKKVKDLVVSPKPVVNSALPIPSDSKNSSYTLIIGFILMIVILIGLVIYKQTF